MVSWILIRFRMRHSFGEIFPFYDCPSFDYCCQEQLQLPLLVPLPLPLPLQLPATGNSQSPIHCCQSLFKDLWPCHNLQPMANCIVLAICWLQQSSILKPGQARTHLTLDSPAEWWKTFEDVVVVVGDDEFLPVIKNLRHLPASRESKRRNFFNTKLENESFAW